MQPQSDGAGRTSGSTMRSLAKVAGISVVAAVIFLFGVGVGRGNVLFSAAGNPANKDLPEDLDYASVEQVYDLLKTNYDGKLDVTKLLDGLKTGLASSAGDPYTQF